MRRLPVFLSIIGLISLIGLIGIKGKGIVYAASSSKLGIFLLASYNGGSNGGEKIINACPKVVTFYDPQNSSERLQLLRDYKTKCPGGISVIRIHDALEGKQVDFTKDPAKTADEFSTLILAEVNKIGNSALVNYVSGTNEFENYDDEELIFQLKTEKWQWLGRFWVRLAQNISQAGYKPNIGDLNVGHPTEVSVFEVLFPALREIKKLGGAFSYHGYTIDYSMNGAGSTEGEKSLRYRLFYDYFRKMGASDLLDLPLLITETGVAEGGDRLQGFMPNNIEKFKQWLEWYDTELQKDGYVIGATIFQSGDIGQWASFNTDYIAEWLCTKLGGMDCKVTVAEYTGPSGGPVDKCANKPSKVEELKQFLGNLFQKNVSDLRRINKGNLPPVNIDSGGAKKDDDCPDEAADSAVEGAQQHNIAASIKQPPSETSTLNWWQSSWDKVKDAFSFGNKKAEEYASSSLPPNVASEALASQGDTLQGERTLAEGKNTGNVLGLFSSKDQAMEKALPLLQCAGLPASLCENNMPLGSDTGGSLTPAPSGGPGISIAPPPAGGGGYGSVGKCELGYGYCSVEYLKPFFDNDQIKAEKASQICQRESGSDPTALNDSCLPKYAPQERTLDYSVGLFQYNLAASNNRCPAGITRDPWDTEGYCRVVNESELSICRNRFYDPNENINKAVQLSTTTSGKGTYWGHWSAAGPDYCDVL